MSGVSLFLTPEVRVRLRDRTLIPYCPSCAQGRRHGDLCYVGQAIAAEMVEETTQAALERLGGTS